MLVSFIYAALKLVVWHITSPIATKFMIVSSGITISCSSVLEDFIYDLMANSTPNLTPKPIDIRTAKSISKAIINFV